MEQEELKEILNKPVINIEPRKKGPWWRESMMLFAQVSAWTLVPLFVGLVAARWFTTQYHSELWTYISIAAAFVVSMIGVVRSTMNQFKKIIRDPNAPVKPTPEVLEREVEKELKQKFPDGK